MNRVWWKRTGIEILFIFFVSLTPLLWFRDGMVMVGHDHVAPLNPTEFFQGRFTTWNDQFFGRSQVLILGTMLIHFFDAIPSYLGFNLVATQKIVFVFWFFMIGVSAYALATVISGKSRLFKLLAVLLYQFNFFILQGWWIGEKSKFSAYIAAPFLLSVFLLVDSGRLPPVSGAILNSFVLFVFNASGLYGIPLYGGLFVVMGAFVVFALVEHWFKKNTAAFQRLVHLTLATLVLGVLVNAYVYLPAYSRLGSQLGTGIAQIGGISGVISWASEISANTSFVNLMRLQGISEWYDNPAHPYAKDFLTNPFLVGLSFIWPILVFSSLFASRTKSSRRLVLYFFLVYLLGLFFAAGTHPPLGFLYQFLVEKIPGFLIFRTPYFKFASAIFLANTFLIALFIENLSGRFRKIVYCLVAVVIVGYHFPFFTGNFFEWRKGFSTRLTVPGYVYAFGRWLNQQPKIGTRVLMLPPNSPDLQYGLYNWGYLSFQALPTLLSNASVIVNNDQLNSDERTLVMSLYSAILRGDTHNVEILGKLLGISHLLVSLDAHTQVKSAIPIEPGQYLAGIQKTGLFELEEAFDQWQVYRSVKELNAQIYVVDGVNSIDAQVEDIPSIANLLIPAYDFVQKNESTGISLKPNAQIIVPSCINCFKQSRPIIVFPERNILPGDPLYSLLLFSERLRRRPTDPKSSIYNALGMTLKRLSEINELLYRQKVMQQETVDRFVGLLSSIEADFGRLQSPADRAKVALDIAQYLRAQRNYLRPNLGKYVVSGTQTTLTGSIFSSIHGLEKVVEPFVADLEQPNVRVYQFELQSPKTLNVSVRDARLIETLSAIRDVALYVDDQLLIAGNIDTSSNSIPFGTVQLPAGFHTLRLILPKTQETSLQLVQVDTEFSVQNEAICFGATAKNISSGRLYKIIATYFNDFSDNLLFLLWEKGQDTQRLVNAIRLSAGPFEEKAEYVFDVSSGVTGIEMAFCAPNLTQERIEKQFGLKMSEALFPTVVLAANNGSPFQHASVDATRLSSTRYKVNLPLGVTYPVLLVFPSRYDPWWKLTGAEATHIRINGYANAWVIHKPADVPLTLSYQGQEYFLWGLAVSGIVLLGGILVYRRNRRLS